MYKSIKFLVIFLTVIVIITTLFGSNIKSLERFVSYASATCVCPPGYVYTATEPSHKRCTRKGAPSLAEECTCPEKFTYLPPAAAATRCYDE
mgnify:CR=1 FL=1